jgi:hypothetical protein
LTLDGLSIADSAFAPCTAGDTIGDTCIVSCREGFYSSVGSGTAQFRCTHTAGGLWMQQVLPKILVPEMSPVIITICKRWKITRSTPILYLQA